MMLTPEQVCKLAYNCGLVEFDQAAEILAKAAYAAGAKDMQERCAKVVDSVNNYDNPMTATDCAEAIRALETA